jgi:hypothetical protein
MTYWDLENIFSRSVSSSEFSGERLVVLSSILSKEHFFVFYSYTLYLQNKIVVGIYMSQIIEDPSMDARPFDAIAINIKDEIPSPPKNAPTENIKLLSNAFNAFKSTRRRSINEMDGEKYYAESGSDLSDSEDSTTNVQGQHVKKLYKRLNYYDVENSINKYYFDENHRHSSSLDILASYLEGQKMIYMESKYYSEQQLNKLMMPAIMLSTAATVVAAVVKDYNWGAFFLSSINALIAFLLALVN